MATRKRSKSSSSNEVSKRRRLPSRAGTECKQTAARDTTLFKEIWRILRKDAWTSKPPRRSSLDTRYRYVKPGQDPDGVEGQDYFLGEDALVMYYSSLNDPAIRVEGGIVTVLPTGSRFQTALAFGQLDNDVVQNKRIDDGRTVASCSTGILGDVGGRGVHTRRCEDEQGETKQEEVDYGDDFGEGYFQNNHEVEPRLIEALCSGTRKSILVGRHDGDVGEEDGGIEFRADQINSGDDQNGSGCGELHDVDAVGEEGSELDGQVEEVSEGGEEPGDRIFEGSAMAGHGRGQCGVACGERDDIVAPETEQNIGDNEHSDQGEVTSELYVDSLVAFTLTKEQWMVTKILKPVLGQVGNSYIVGRVCKRTAKNKTVLYEIRWLDSLFQNQVHLVEIGVVQRGIENYRLLTRTTSTAKPTWNALITVPENESLPSDATIEDLVEMENLDEFDLDRPIPASLREVEAVKSMKFDPSLELEAPTDLYSHSDGSTKTRVRPDSIRLFTHSASSSFLAYIPLYFWRQVLNETNAYGVVKGVKLQPAVTLTELLKFVGILFYMSINDKGEYANYWGIQPEDMIVGNGNSSGLEMIMSLRRFKLIRKCFCFVAAPPPTNGDPAARIRPLLNLLKCTGGRYIDIGRNVALDESSIACRSKFGRHMIVYNPMKPTGKYHFRLYMLCCATTWVAINYRLHCNSDIIDRLNGVVSADEAMQLRQEWITEKVSAIRSLVLEVARPIYGSNRILNTDNYYTSVQLLQALWLRGLYGRGTVRGTSKHFPRHTMLDKNHSSRGEFWQGVSAEHGMVAASWCDGNVVQIVSNADGSGIGHVERQVGATAQSFSAPVSVKNYNQFMQGVDRLDQIRARFSLADGHSYKKWHKKLALALLDVARSNAYLTRRCVLDVSKQRDPHRTFVIELASELISGRWVDAPSDSRMAFEATYLSNDVEDAGNHTSPRELFVSTKSDYSPRKDCTAVASRQVFQNCGRKRRGCGICRWEDR